MNSSGYNLAKGSITPPMLYPAQIRFGWQAPRDEQVVLVDNEEGHSAHSPAQEESGLFRMFAELATISEILEFANRFGQLHNSVERGYYREDGQFWPAEPIAFWLYCIAQVRSTVRLLDGFQGKVNLADHFSVYPEGLSRTPTVVYFTHPEFKAEILDWAYLYPDIPDEPNDPETLWEAGRHLPIGADCLYLRDGDRAVALHERGDFRLLAGLALQQWLDGELTKPNCPWHGLSAGIRPSVRKAGDGFVLRLLPTTLLDLIWLQLAQAMTGGREYRKCAAPACSRWFAVVEFGRQRRKDRIYCSAACKTRAFREKRTKEQEAEA